MTANRSLDEFSDAGPVEGDDGPGESTAPGAAERPSDATPGGAVADEPAPPATTYAWSPDGGPCASCGETVEGRWRDGDALVCADCKAW